MSAIDLAVTRDVSAAFLEQKHKQSARKADSREVESGDSDDESSLLAAPPVSKQSQAAPAAPGRYNLADSDSD